jgi:hypothetical protein
MQASCHIEQARKPLAAAIFYDRGINAAIVRIAATRYDSG